MAERSVLSFASLSVRKNNSKWPCDAVVRRTKFDQTSGRKVEDFRVVSFNNRPLLHINISSLYPGV